MLDFLKHKKDETKSLDKDIGFIQDVSGMVRDMVAFESHCIDEYASQGSDSSIEDLEWMRRLRAFYLDMIVKEGGHNWCKSKHLHRIMIGLQEACSRFISVGEFERAKRASIDCGEVFIRFLKMNGLTIKDLNKSNSSA